MLLGLAHEFQLDPTEFGMIMVEQRLLELAPRHPLSAREEDTYQTSVKSKTGTWIMPSEEARSSGMSKMKGWIERVGRAK